MTEKMLKIYNFIISNVISRGTKQWGWGVRDWGAEMYAEIKT